jgi:nicotinamidase-related amidase
MMRARPERAGKRLIENTWDWRIVDAVSSAPGEHVVKKTRYSLFTELSTTRFWPALSNAIVSFLPSIAATLSLPNFW